MSEDNVEAFIEGARAVAAGNDEIVAGLVHPEVVFEPQRAATEGAYEGRDGIRRFVADTRETFEVFRAEYSDIRALGARVLAIGTIHLRGSGSGVETDIPTAVVAEYRDGLLWRYKDYREAAVALTAAGVTPTEEGE